MNARLGFLRIAFVLSLAWIALIGGVATYEYFFAYQPNVHWFVIYTHGTKVEPSSGIVWDAPKLLVHELLFALFVPVVIGWAALLGLLFGIPWVRRGFHS